MASKVTSVLFDKTGTIGRGRPAVREVNVIEHELDETTVWSLAASIEHRSEHLIGKSIYNHAVSKPQVRLREIQEFSAASGLGVKGVVDMHSVIIGNRVWLSENDVS